MKASIISLLMILSSSILIATPARSETVFVGSAENKKVKLYIDTASITVNRKFVDASIIIQYLDNPEGVGSMRGRQRVNCSNKSTIVLNAIGFTPSGKTIPDSRRTKPEWSSIESKSIGDSMYKFLCRYQNRK